MSRFFTQGGRALVVEEEDVKALGDELRFPVLARERVRQRRMLVLGPPS